MIVKYYKTIIFITFIFLLSGSIFADSNPWVVIDKIKFDWNQDKKIDQIILDTPQGWEYGDFTRIRIKIAGKKEFLLNDEAGLIDYSSQFPKIFKLSKIKSKYLALVPISKNKSECILMIFGFAYGSRPGMLYIIALNHDGSPEKIFENSFNIADFRDINRDSLPELIGFHKMAQGLGFIGEKGYIMQYNPYSVYKLVRETKGIRMFYDINLCKLYNNKYGPGWAGPKIREDIVIVVLGDRSKPKLMKKDEAFKQYIKDSKEK